MKTGATERVLEILAAASGPMTAGDIAAALWGGNGRGRVTILLKQMQESGLIWAVTRADRPDPRPGPTPRPVLWMLVPKD